MGVTAYKKFTLPAELLEMSQDADIAEDKEKIAKELRKIDSMGIDELNIYIDEKVSNVISGTNGAPLDEVLKNELRLA